MSIPRPSSRASLATPRFTRPLAKGHFLRNPCVAPLLPAALCLLPTAAASGDISWRRRTRSGPALAPARGPTRTSLPAGPLAAPSPLFRSSRHCGAAALGLRRLLLPLIDRRTSPLNDPTCLIPTPVIRRRDTSHSGRSPSLALVTAVGQLVQIEAVIGRACTSPLWHMTHSATYDSLRREANRTGAGVKQNRRPGWDGGRWECPVATSAVLSAISRG